MSERDEATAVAEPEAVLTKEDLQTQLNGRRTRMQAAASRQRELEQQSVARGLSLLETQELVGLERWQQIEQAQLDALAARIGKAQYVFDVEAAVTHHDAHVAAQRAKHEAVRSAYNALLDALDALAAGADAQRAPLYSLRAPGGEPFTIPQGAEVVANVVSVMPAPRWMPEAMSAGKIGNEVLAAMMGNDAGTKPVDPGVIRRFVEGRRA